MTEHAAKTRVQTNLVQDHHASITRCALSDASQMRLAQAGMMLNLRQLMVNSHGSYGIVSLCWWFGILGIPLSNNPFQKGILGIETAGPQTDN